MYYISRIAGSLALAALGAGVWFAIILARADAYFRAATPETVRKAVEIAPRNTDHLALRALQLDYEGVDSTALTEKIAVLNPRASAPRIKLGLAAEMRGDSALAERWLLDAASVDHQFEPRWTLANFYFRAGNRNDDFWKWMRAALEVSYGDRTPAFDLCWRVSQDPEEIFTRGIPDRHEVTGAYLVYLSETKRLAATAAVARRLAADHDASDLPLLLGVGDELLAAHDTAAVEVWQLTGQAAPQGVFNGDFKTAPSNHGFDWRAIESPGVTHVNLDTPPGHRIVLSGQEAESVSLLEQTLRLGAGKRYRLQWESRTAGIGAATGLEWRAGGRHAALLPSADWTTGEFIVDAPEMFNLLDLAYQRPVGESRAEGNVELRHIRLMEIAR